MKLLLSISGTDFVSLFLRLSLSLNFCLRFGSVHFRFIFALVPQNLILFPLFFLFTALLKTFINLFYT